jgi:D-alanyl-lipoteichoic acid acyltransferase DltB (MBOAT superfamily)
MLFNSYIFILAFFPIVFLGFFRIAKYSHAVASLWLVAASLFFYGWWDVRFVGLLLGSILFNYCAGYLIAHRIASTSVIPSRTLLTCTIAVNLILLGYFKYANFFADNLNNLMGATFPIAEIILPLGISFFTFTQIAFLVDTHQGKVKEFSFLRYTLFVTYFPHLIAGPVLHHKEMMPQFAKKDICHLSWDNVAVGLSIFVLGLAKKVLIADSLADFSAPIFNAVAAGAEPMLFEAWIGALSYTLQLYFDFSGYSDMAIGLSLMLNVRLPMNFNSPYKATSIIDFWRRWHMTLSRFLRDYIYIPLGGSRNGKAHRYLNLMVTMLLGGLWHGAGWTYVIWGGLHGLYLLVNHSWRGLKQKLGWEGEGKLATLCAGALTFLGVVVGWVFFRADSCSSALALLHGMAGMNGVSLLKSLDGLLGPHDGIVFLGLAPLAQLNSVKVLAVLGLGFMIVWRMPNVWQMFQQYRPVCEDMHTGEPIKSAKASQPIYGEPRRSILHAVQWKPTTSNLAVISLLLVSALGLLNRTSVFLYFQF